MKMECQYKLAQDIEIVDIENESLLLDTSKCTITKVNSMGAEILHALSEQMSLENLVNWLQTEYGIEADTACNDTLEFLKEAQKLGLVTNE